MCIWSSSCKLRVKELIFELHLKAERVRKHLSILLNLKVGVRIVAKARDNWKHHEICEKDAILLYQPEQELTKLRWIFPSKVTVKHMNWRNATTEWFFLPLWAPSTHVQAMCDTDMLMPRMCL